MELAGFTGFLAIAMIALARQTSAYTGGSSFIEQRSLDFAPNVPRFRARHWEHRFKADGDSDQQEEETSDSDDQQEEKTSDSNEGKGGTEEKDYTADLKSDLEQAEAEIEQTVEQEEAEEEAQEEEAEAEAQEEEDKSKTDTTTSPANSTAIITTTITATTFPKITTTALPTTTQLTASITTTQVPLNNENGNAAKVYVFNKEGKQISFDSTPASAEQLKAAVVRACKIQHLPLDRKTTCYCQYGPPPKKKLPKGKRMRTASFVAERKVASMRCQCTRNNTLGVHEQAVKDAIARKSLLSQTKKIAEETLRRYATEENRNKLSAIVTKQVAASQEVKQAMEQVQTKIQDSFQKMEAQAEIERAKEVLPDLDGLIEDDREYQRRLREMRELQALKARDMMASLKHHTQTESKELLFARVKEKEEQVRRLVEGIGLVKELVERRKSMLAARERTLGERDQFENMTVTEWETLLQDLYDQTKDVFNKNLADLLQHWKDKTDALKRRLERLKNMNASDFGRDARIDAMTSMLARLYNRTDSEKRLLDKEHHDYSSPCSSNVQCKAFERCLESACFGVALNAPCTTSYDCGNMQVCTKQVCVAMTPPAGSPCTSTADCGEGAKCSLNKCVIVSAGAACIAHADCAKGQLCQAQLCQWMTPAAGLPCTKNAEGFDTCTIGQRCDSNNECQVISEGSRCKIHKDCASGQGCIGLKCRFFNPPTGSPCMKTQECAIGHRCTKNVCDLRQSGKVCTQQVDCGFGQRCDQGLCRIIDRHSPCASHTECGNGQRCLGASSSKKSGKCEGFSSRGRTCAGNSECPMFFRCIFGKCSRVLPHAHCTDVSQCGNRMVCEQFACIPDKSFPGLKPPRMHPCKATMDCHETRDCVVGWCMVVPRELANCKDASSCGNEQSCSATVCVARYASGYPQEGGLCKQKEDCANGQFCNKQRCHDKGEALSCKKPNDCGLAQQCLGGQCIADGATCTSDVHCFTFQTCLSGKCASVFPDSPCLAHPDCGNEQLCDLVGKQRQCKKASPGLNKSCQQDSDCGTGMRCDETKRTCVWVPVGTLCQTDGFILAGTNAIAGLKKRPPPCGNGQVCFVQECVWTVPAEGTPCKTAFDCGTDQTCAGDKPKPTVCITAPQGTNCNDHPDCGNGQRCEQKKCLRASETRRRRNHPKAGCKLTSECGAREVCTASQCVGQFHRGQDVPDGSPCTSQSACGFGQKCISSACRLIPKDSVCKSSADCGNGRQCAEGACLDTPAGTLCGGRYNDHEEEQNKQKKPAAIGGECGVHQMCRLSRCRNLFGGHIATAVAQGSKCLTHSECSFRQRCVRSACKLVQAKVHCSSNGDCGNGQMCLGLKPGRPGLCTVLPEGKKCVLSSSLFNKQDDFVPPDACNACNACLSFKGECSTKIPKAKCVQLAGSRWCGPPDADDATTSGGMCANGQLCLGGVCHNQFGAVAPSHFVRGRNSLPPNELLRAHWVPEGTLCSTDYECGAAQACGDDGHCSSVADGSRCQLTKHCANGQRCTPGSYLCQMEREGSACSSTADCPKTSACLNAHCVYQFGHLLGLNIARRAEDLFNKNSEWRARIEVMLKKALATMEAKQKNSSYDMELAQETKQLQDEYSKLVLATKVLNKEVDRRVDNLLTSSDVQGGGTTCALCIAEQDIQKLLDEIERLKSVLERCKNHPEAYIPNCEQDLNFQINKLKEEVTRRRALLEEEVRQLHEEERRLQKQLNACRSGAGGCEQTSEHRLLLQIMRAQDQLYRRRKKKRMDDQLLVLKCLWNNRKTPQTEKIAIFFKSSVSEGCDKTEHEFGAFLKLNQTLMNNQTKAIEQNQTRALKDCLCKEHLSEKQVSEEARKRVQQANVAWKTATDNAATQQERAAAERRKQKEVADKVAKDLVYENFKKSGDWKTALQQLRDRNKDKVGKMTEEASKEVQAQSKPPPLSDDQIDLNKLTDCVAPIADLTVRQNIKSTFTEGPARNGCALLSLAKTHVIHMAYLCLCDAAGTVSK